MKNRSSILRRDFKSDLKKSVAEKKIMQVDNNIQFARIGKIHLKILI